MNGRVGFLIISYFMKFFNNITDIKLTLSGLELCVINEGDYLDRNIECGNWVRSAGGGVTVTH